MSRDSSAADTALDQLYREHRSWLHGWISRRVGCRDNAADLAQDVFVRLLRSGKPSGLLLNPRAYLGSVARGLMIDQYRRRALEQAYLESISHFDEAQAPSEEERLLLLETLEQLDRLLDGLKPRVRQVFLLAQLDGLTCPQIAERIGMSRATVERDLAKALMACYRSCHEPY
ncbi:MULTISPECIES: sigma-70 family RNA polymerase sigma factor [Pseudomonas]|jgi:RNA polymerase sigma-70 factor (ECF subfamily)|uniref:sigma-70 family RNA polymerase sigma factor n=1 Tax=Pseudomonas TaxID=286 RepID=UPI00137A92CA|nr:MULTISPECIES: sigma-70 family RNA polymerase sigma factor [Pseudomonas]